MFSRRQFLATQALAASSLALSQSLTRAEASFADPAPTTNIGLGLVTYMWGHDWDLPTLIKNCEDSNFRGVELRTTHKHGVECELSTTQRESVKKRFADSNVVLVGIGSNERFDDPDPSVVKKAIAATKEFIRLSHDTGSSGVKVKPDSFHPNVPREKTIEQIGKSLNIVGKYAADFGQQIRLEIHGKCGELPTIKAIMDVADNKNVAVCWNSNAQDLQGAGLEKNFDMVAKRFGATVHVRTLDDPAYPYDKFFQLLDRIEYEGWILLEDGRIPKDRVAKMKENSLLFDKLLASSSKS
ncbi:MAG: sugar phosphate isomerase/epimerase [Pirellulaceae bacterium]|jgi:sugar phosphate isomerase/epimerase